MGTCLGALGFKFGTNILKPVFTAVGAGERAGVCEAFCSVDTEALESNMFLADACDGIYICLEPEAHSKAVVLLGAAKSTVPVEEFCRFWATTVIGVLVAVFCPAFGAKLGSFFCVLLNPSFSHTNGFICTSSSLCFSELKI